MADVFFSYHVESASKIVHEIAERLEALEITSGQGKRKISCWYCERDMKPGEVFSNVIPTQINSCGVFLLILDADALESKHVNLEMEQAGKRFTSRGGKPITILPYCVEKCELTGSFQYYLTNIQSINGIPHTQESADALVKAVADALEDIEKDGREQENGNSSQPQSLKEPEQEAGQEKVQPPPDKSNRRRKAKAFVFFIGGTGAKVLLSFLHICAAGALPGKSPIQMILLDMDTNESARNEAMSLYNIYRMNYDRIHSSTARAALRFSEFPAFGRELYLSDMTPISPKTATLDLKMAGRNTEVLNWLYTDLERGQNLSNGVAPFANIGYAYFQDIGRQFDACAHQICASVMNGEDVRVVMVGSVFGGTGAAGISGALKSIQRACQKMSHQIPLQMVKRHLHFGGVFVTPYFKLPEPDDTANASRVSSDAFYHNAQLALSYYAFRHAHDFEKIYLVGQKELQWLGPADANARQERMSKPHAVELMAALGVKDFLQTTRSASSTQIFSQILDINPSTPVFTWDSLDPDLSAVSDMLRTQALLKATFAPYVECPGFFKQNWYKTFNMSAPGRKEELRSIMEYTDIFLNWIYNLQYALPENGEGPMVRDERIALVSPLIEHLVSGDCQSDDFCARFHELLNRSGNPRNISYRYDDARQLMFSVGKLNQEDSRLADLGALGMVIRLFKQVTLKREQSVSGATRRRLHSDRRI